MNTKKTWLFLLCIVFIGCCTLAASHNEIHRVIHTTHRTRHHRTTPPPSSRKVGSVRVPQVPLPTHFVGMKTNHINDPYGVLGPFFEQLRENVTKKAHHRLRIVQVGDSFVEGHIFPNAIKAQLTATFPGVTYQHLGINGATTVHFNRPEKIAQLQQLQPDLLILSFGTNESYPRGYQQQQHANQLHDFLRALRQAMPQVPILMTTPPGCYVRTRIANHRYAYRPNPRTATAVQVITQTAKTDSTAYWNLYHIVGGKTYACRNWYNAKVYRPDRVHFVHKGYQLQGQLFSRAFIKAYNAYVSHH